MRKTLLPAAVLACSLLVLSCRQTGTNTITPADEFIEGKIGKMENEEEDGYDGAAERDLFELNQIKDPALGYVPMERLEAAIEFTENIKARKVRNRVASALTWTERGPNFDVAGPYGNPRGGTANATAGRIRAVLIDTLNDPTGNTVIVGAVSGGIWKCTNFLSAVPNWQPINDRFDNLAISSIAQNPANPMEMYFSTGEPSRNADAVFGAGVWKSVNGGATWTKLPGTSGFVKVFKLLCDATGNIYLANRVNSGGLPTSVGSGIFRSKDGGASWVDITPVSRTSSNAICSDLEISTTGRLHVSFGFQEGTASHSVQHQYTDDAGNATSATGWNESTGIRLNTTETANRLELATLGNTLYAITTNTSNNVDSCYKSIDGGATWTIQNTTAFPTGVLNTQGWYNIILGINPANDNEIIMGGLDAYRSTNGGATLTRLTHWVTQTPYVHADLHFIQWWNAGAQSRVIIACDGGMFLSNDGGASWADRNRNLAIKQFYAATMHPDAGSNYMLAGAQDNGVHQFTQPGLGSSTEVNGGDGCFVHINQQNPQVQFGSYIRNSYNRSTDGGSNWQQVTFSSSNGLFINPYDYDDGQNAMYASWGVSNAPNNSLLRWLNANSSTSASLLTLSALTRNAASNATAFKVSPHTQNRLFVGSSNGSLVRLDNAATVTSATVNANVTNLTSANFPAANIGCVNTGSSDNTLVAVFTNYGVQHVWVSTNGGTNWTNIDGNLPDMPVRWAVFNPQDDNKLYLATEAGVYYTDAINGSSTVWTSDPGFPTVKTNMLKIRLSDNTIQAATHGRGIFTAKIPATPEVRFNANAMAVTEAVAGTVDCRRYRDYTIKTSVIAPPTGNATVSFSTLNGATAVEGEDFDYTTNGDFTNRSHQLVFTNGIAATKEVTVRVYDDAAIEAEKMFTLQMVVTGSTDAFTGPYNKFTFTIRDNDVAPTSYSSYSIGAYETNATGMNGNVTSTFMSDRVRHRTQVLYTATELKAAGFNSGNITSMMVRVVTKNSTKPFKGYTISMANTSSANLNFGFTSNVLTPVFSADYTSQVGDNLFAFNTPFFWNGTSNLLVQFCFDNGTESADALADVMEASSAPLGVSVRSTTLSEVLQSGGTNGCSLPASYVNDPRIRAVFGVGNKVSSTVNTTMSEGVGSNSTVHFYAGLDILAKLSNASANLGCVSASILEAGNTWQPFLAGQRSQKVLRMTPAANGTATYTASLYFSAEELSTFAANPATLKLAKTTATTMTEATTANTVLQPTTFTPFGSGFIFTANFTGFSSFFLVNDAVVLPISLLTFQGKLDNNTALLSWSTSTEQNAHSFDVEKSTDGNNYVKIGTVKAAGNSNTRRDYTFRDVRLNEENFYRLRMNDNDGRGKNSLVVRLSSNSSTQQVWVLNNPFGQSLAIRFGRQAKKAHLQLLTAGGALVAEKQLANPATQITWQLPVRITAGSYLLRSVVDGTVYTSKLVKQ